VNPLQDLLERNEQWARRMRTEQPDFLPNLAQLHTPRCLWIGCSDSRVSPETILSVPPGTLYVHRNMANLAVPSDLSSQSTLQYAIEVLKIPDIIVCGHSGCVGVKAALHPSPATGPTNRWLQYVRDLVARYRDRLASWTEESDRHDRLVRLNIVEQVFHIARSSTLQNAWNRGQNIGIHGWLYNLADGRIEDLAVSLSAGENLEAAYPAAVEKILSS
jgi:carbonic anhydrase